jgi:hypothetical protein
MISATAEDQYQAGKTALKICDWWRISGERILLDNNNRMEEGELDEFFTR